MQLKARVKQKSFYQWLFLLALCCVKIFSPSSIKAANYEVLNTYFYENYSAIDSITRGTSLALISRTPQKLTLFGKVTYQRKFDQNESLQEAGAAYSFNDWLTLQGSTGFSVGTHTFPKSFLDLETVIRLQEKLLGHVGYRFSHFDNSNVHIYPLGLTWSLFTNLSLHGRFLHAITDFEHNGTVSNNSFLLKTSFYGLPRQELHVLYANNSESFLSIDRVGEFSADTYGLSWKGSLGVSWALLASIYHQKRFTPINQSQNTFEIGWSYTW